MTATDDLRCRRCGLEDYWPYCPSCQHDRDEALAKLGQMIADGRLNGQIHGGTR
jgi:hypothetical protein